MLRATRCCPFRPAAKRKSGYALSRSRACMTRCLLPCSTHEGSLLHRVAVFKTSGVALAGRARGCISLTDLTPLACLKKLESLNLSWCENLRSLNGLEGLDTLTNLYLDGCVSLRDINPVAALTNLEVLSFDKCRAIRDVSPLYGHKKLHLLSFDGLCSLDEIECVLDGTRTHETKVAPGGEDVPAIRKLG